MKKINSISYGGQILFGGAIFLFGIPALLYAGLKIFQYPILELGIKISIGIGGLIAVIFTLLLSVEFRQDDYLNQYYQAHKNIKLPLENGLCECQACGNRYVRPQDRNCMICGILLEDCEEKGAA